MRILQCLLHCRRLMLKPESGYCTTRREARGKAGSGTRSEARSEERSGARSEERNEERSRKRSQAKREAKSRAEHRAKHEEEREAEQEAKAREGECIYFPLFSFIFQIYEIYFTLRL